MNLDDKYQNFLLFIALPIADNEGWTLNVWLFPPHLYPATKLGDGAYRLDGNQA